MGPSRLPWHVGRAFSSRIPLPRASFASPGRRTRPLVLRSGGASGAPSGDVGRASVRPASDRFLRATELRGSVACWRRVELAGMVNQEGPGHSAPAALRSGRGPADGDRPPARRPFGRLGAVCRPLSARPPHQARGSRGLRPRQGLAPLGLRQTLDTTTTPTTKGRCRGGLGMGFRFYSLAVVQVVTRCTGGSVVNTSERGDEVPTWLLRRCVCGHTREQHPVKVTCMVCACGSFEAERVQGGSPGAGS